MKLDLDTLPTVRGKLLFDQSLAPYTWFRVGGPADVLFLPKDEEDLADFLSQLSFLASTLGPDIQNVQSGFNYLKRLFALLTRPLVAYQAGIEPSVQEFKELLAKVEGRLPDYYNALNQVDEITRRLETVLGVPTESAQETGEMLQVCIPTPGAIC